jgi:GNAT superfamily N-acetyltransferase
MNLKRREINNMLEGNNDQPIIEIKNMDSQETINLGKEILMEYEDAIGVDLCFQNFQEEVKNLPGKYAPPEGAFLLAFIDGQLAGCVALRKNLDKICEMKRLYVRKDFRKHKIGLLLVKAVIEEAKKLGYDKLRLDTLPTMQAAQRIYEEFGFQDIEPYIYHPMEGTRYMELQLK